MYTALKYIGNDYTPGEILPDDLPPELIERLLKMGAIRKTAPDPVVHNVEEPIAPEAEEIQTPNAKSEDIETEPKGEPDDEEIGEGEVDPEIDAMDGIVQETPEPERQPPKKPAARRPAEKKQTGGRKAK